MLRSLLRSSIAFVLVVSGVLLTGCPTTQVPSTNTNDNSNTGRNQPCAGDTCNPPPDTNIYLENGQTSFKAISNPEPTIFAIRSSGDLFAGRVENFTLQCRVNDRSGLRFVIADLSACGGPSDAELLADDLNDPTLYIWQGPLSPLQPGLARCSLVATDTNGNSNTVILLIGVFGTGVASAPQLIDARGFVTLVLEPTTTSSNSNCDLDVNGISIFTNSTVDYPYGKQISLDLDSGDNTVNLRGRGLLSAWRVRFLEGVDFRVLFDGVLLLGANQDAQFFVRVTPGQRLNDVTVNRTPARIQLRDYAIQDGDRVDVFLNDVLIGDDLTMTNAGVTLSATLRRGANTIRIRANNVGSLPPNTAEIRFVDENNVVSGPASQHWGLNTDEEAVMTVTLN